MAKTKVFINDREPVSKAADGKSTGAFPDPCWSPPGPPAGPVVIPYPNSVKDKDLTNGTSTVFIKGTQVAKEDESYISTSTGNEAATDSFGKGVATGARKGKAVYKSWSTNVKFEGKGIPRHLDLITHNHGSEPGNTVPNVEVSSANPKDDKEKKKMQTEIALHISLFFDGTLNNRTNTNDPDNKAKFKQTGSYINDTSNIAKLEPFIMDFEIGNEKVISKAFYVEGIGTEDKKEDSNIVGAGLGQGSTGVKSKVKKGMNEKFGKFITSTYPIPSLIKIKYIYFYIFGFSRGAAAARYCVHLILNKTSSTIPVSEWLKLKGYEAGPVKVKFVGLYDTVASYGAVHYNDTSDLKLDSIKEAEKVVHIAAAEEHRINFRLTNIKSAGSKGVEVFLPGVHSDIGGGYSDNYPENFKIFGSLKGDMRVNTEKNLLLSLGYFNEKEIELRERAEFISSGYNVVRIDYVDIWVNRAGISNKYSYIPLHLMVKFAKESNIKFKDEIAGKYQVPSDLQWLQDQINAMPPAQLQINRWWLDRSDIMKKVRHKYLHFSAYYGATLGANDPNFIGILRERVIQDG